MWRAAAAGFAHTGATVTTPEEPTVPQSNPRLHPMTNHHRLILLAFASAALTTYGADAAANWTESCAKCHGADGKGDTKMGKKLSIADLTADKIDTLILTGGSTQIPAILQRLRANFPDARFVETDAFGSVGLGLALDAARKFG